MNSGYLILGLGILAIVAGAALYITHLHRSIGLGGMGLGIVLILLGIWTSRKTMKPSVPM